MKSRYVANLDLGSSMVRGVWQLPNLDMANHKFVIAWYNAFHAVRGHRIGSKLETRWSIAFCSGKCILQAEHRRRFLSGSFVRVDKRCHISEIGTIYDQICRAELQLGDATARIRYSALVWTRCHGLRHES